jgi:FtsH-binding integral membrane protein
VRTFALSVWAALILAFVAFAIVMWGLAKFPDERQESTRYRSFVETLQALMAVFLNVSVNHMPSKILLRLFFCLWIWSSFALTTVFQIYFTSFLVDPGHKKQVSDVEELLASNLILTFDSGYKDLFLGTDERAKLILSRHVSCPNFKACARRTATIGDAATILDFERFGIFKHKFVDDDGNSLLCRLPDKISGYQITMFMQKGNPLFRPVDGVILRLLEAGLVDFWWSMLVYMQKFSTEKEGGVAPITFFVFSLSHLYVAFTFLTLGYCLGIFVFILEILYKKCVEVTKSVDSSAQ